MLFIWQLQDLLDIDGTYIVLRYQDGKSDKFYGLQALNGRYRVNWGRFGPYPTIDITCGQSKSHATAQDIKDLLEKKMLKGYELHRIRNLNGPKEIEGFEDAYSLIPKKDSRNLIGLYSLMGDLLSFLDRTTALRLLNTNRLEFINTPR